MSEMNDFLRRASARSGYVRARYAEKNMPDDPSQVAVYCHFGDIRSTFTLSSLLLRRFREEVKGSKYFILCSWPGCECLFPYADEYWGIADEEKFPDLYYAARGFENEQTHAQVRGLNWFFEDVADYRSIRPYYDFGITEAFFERFRHVKRFLPSVLSAAVLGDQMAKQLVGRESRTVFVYPSLRACEWKRGRHESLRCPKEFWVSLVESLVSAGFVPVIGIDRLTHGLVGDVPEACVHVQVSDMSMMLAAMRHVDCVLDMFFGNSCLALASRSPFVACTERQAFYGVKQYEIDDLCSEKGLPRRYAFCSPRVLSESNRDLWASTLVDGTIQRLDTMISSTDRNLLPSTSESSIIIPYDNVRKLRRHRLGTRFIRRTKRSDEQHGGQPQGLQRQS